MADAIETIQKLAKFVGARVIHDTFSGLATKDTVRESIGRAMYAAEAPEGKPWEHLTLREKNVWRARAGHAVLALRDYVVTPPKVG